MSIDLWTAKGCEGFPIRKGTCAASVGTTFSTFWQRQRLGNLCGISMAVWNPTAGCDPGDLMGGLQVLECHGMSEEKIDFSLFFHTDDL